MTSLNRSQLLENKPRYNLEAFINIKASFNLSSITILQHKVEDAERDCDLHFNKIIQLERQIEYIGQKLSNINNYKYHMQHHNEIVE